MLGLICIYFQFCLYKVSKCKEFLINKLAFNQFIYKFVLFDCIGNCKQLYFSQYKVWDLVQIIQETVLEISIVIFCQFLLILFNCLKSHFNLSIGLLRFMLLFIESSYCKLFLYVKASMNSLSLNLCLLSNVSCLSCDSRWLSFGNIKVLCIIL